jgi:hypothetical protein
VPCRIHVLAHSHIRHPPIFDQGQPRAVGIAQVVDE